MTDEIPRDGDGSTGSKLRPGFIGLGLMGQAFTTRLLQRGYVPVVYDIDAKKTERMSKLGAKAGSSPVEVAAQSDVVLICVTSTDAVEQVVFGAGGVAESAAAHTLLIDHSTTTVAATKTMAGRLRKAIGAGWIDAPVSGGPPAAESGTLAIMAGGSNDDIERVSPLMNELAATFTHFGPVGSGQVAKMVNQVLVLNNYCVLAEALTLAEAGGIDVAKIPDALAAGHAGSNLLQSVFPRMIERDFKPAGYARQVLKDLDMIHDLAKQLGVPTPMSSQAGSLFRLLNAKGYSELDAIAVLKILDPKDSV